MMFKQCGSAVSHLFPQCRIWPSGLNIQVEVIQSNRSSVIPRSIKSLIDYNLVAFDGKKKGRVLFVLFRMWIETNGRTLSLVE